MHRLWVPVPYEPLVTAAARAARVKDWVDVGPGDGIRAAVITGGLGLQAREFVLPPGAREPRIPGWRITHADVRSWHGEGDCVSLLDVIEHLEPDAANRVLERLARDFRVVVVFTPWGFMPQDPLTDPTLAGAPAMWHRSGFVPGDFERRGYVVLGWPLFHPGAQVGAMLAVKCDAAVRPDVEAAMLRAYARSRRLAELPRTIGQWWLAKLRRRSAAR